MLDHAIKIIFCRNVSSKYWMLTVKKQGGHAYNIFNLAKYQTSKRELFDLYFYQTPFNFVLRFHII